MKRKCPIVARALLILTIASLAQFALAVGSTPVVAETCAPVKVSTLMPDETKGVRTKWRFVAGNDARHSFLPNLFGLTAQSWMTELENAGVNLIELNIDPREKLAVKDAVSQKEIDEYGAVADQPPAKLTPSQQTLKKKVEDQLIPSSQYTPEFRSRILINFLVRLEKLRQEGSIKGTAKFLLHQRQWFRPGNSPRRRALREQRSDDFSRDMADIISLAREKCLDHWIAGVRLGESFNRNPALYLQTVAGLAEAINQKTGDWLKDRIFVANGPGMGAQYNGIATAKPAGTFFRDISKQTGSFAFGYKWMQFEGNRARFIARIMDASVCGEQKDCDINSEKDWTHYLGTGLGFNDLKSFVSKNHGSYPNHANVLFVGDSSDSVVLMVAAGQNGLALDPELKALYDLWPDAGTPGWSGRLFMNGFVDAATFPNRPVDEQPDIGAGLIYVDKQHSPHPLPLSQRLWSRWPDPPN